MSELVYNKKVICWITSDYYIDLDLPIVKLLSGKYVIYWNIIYPHANSTFKPEDFQALENQNDLHINHIVSKHRLRHLKNIPFYIRILNRIKRLKSDVIYVNYEGVPYFVFVAALILPKSKTIFTAHQAITHEGNEYKTILKIYFRFGYSWFNFFHLFSITQGNIFKNLYPTKRNFIIPIALKDFGKSSKKRIDDKIVFFNFGRIRANKNIGCLIEAACNLYEKGTKGFHVAILGECENWEQYSRKIKFPELFTCDIGTISNDDISDIFNQYHYLVLPYSALSQSGPIKIAFNYNVPVIASDLEGFILEIEDGINGYLFKNKDVTDLENVLKKAIDNHNDKYDLLRKAQKDFVDKNYSFQSISEKYQEMFNQVSN